MRESLSVQNYQTFLVVAVVVTPVVPGRKAWVGGVVTFAVALAQVASAPWVVWGAEWKEFEVGLYLVASLYDSPFCASCHGQVAFRFGLYCAFMRNVQSGPRASPHLSLARRKILGCLPQNDIMKRIWSY